METFKSFIQNVIHGQFEFLYLVLSKVDVVGLHCVVLAYDCIINSKFFVSWLQNVLCVMIVSVSRLVSRLEILYWKLIQFDYLSASCIRFRDWVAVGTSGSFWNLEVIIRFLILTQYRVSFHVFFVLIAGEISQSVQ